MTSAIRPSTASGHGKPQSPIESPMTASAAIAPTMIRATPRLRSSSRSFASLVPSSGTSSQPAP